MSCYICQRSGYRNKGFFNEYKSNGKKYVSCTFKTINEVLKKADDKCLLCDLCIENCLKYKDIKLSISNLCNAIKSLDDISDIFRGVNFFSTSKIYIDGTLYKVDFHKKPLGKSYKKLVTLHRLALKKLTKYAKNTLKNIDNNYNRLLLDAYDTEAYIVKARDRGYVTYQDLQKITKLNERKISKLDKVSNIDFRDVNLIEETINYIHENKIYLKIIK